MSSSEYQDDDDNIDWEEVDVGKVSDLADIEQGSTDQVTFNIVLSKPGTHSTNKRKTFNTAFERKIRQDVHRAHTLALLSAGLVRNQLLNDSLLKARLLSMVPLPLINAFHSFSPQTHPLERDRSRLFDAALKDLISWWWQTFQVNSSIEGMKSMAWSAAEALYDSRHMAAPSAQVNKKGKSKEHDQDPFLKLLETGEPIHGVKSLMKRAVMMKGSRDMSAQLFTSLLRALDVPARLVFSLQPVSWRGAIELDKPNKLPDEEVEHKTNLIDSSHPTVTKDEKALKKANTQKFKPLSVACQSLKTKTKQSELTTKAAKAAKKVSRKCTTPYRGNITQHGIVNIATNDEGDESDNTPLWDKPSSIGNYPGQINSSSAPTTSRAPVIKLRKSKPPKSRHWAKSPSPAPKEMNRPPVFWTEVYSRPMREWYCVDVTRKRMRCKNIMEPTKTNPENKMIYVIAYEEDNFVRDVTVRYAHYFGAITKKLRLPSKPNQLDWFEKAMIPLRRPFKLVRDTKEDEEMQKARITEAMPTTVIGFKDHPNFALERHLKREEALYPKKPIGTFRGDSVFPRSSVVICKSAETYMREGKRIKGGETPLKMVKPRIVTINRKREEELLKMDGQEAALQGLYAEWQTELLIPPPILDGIIPRNAYGNFDLFAPHMLPRGAKHLPYKGIAKTAKKLKVSYADAVVGFEFHKRRAAPMIEGIIVPELEAEFVLDAYWTSEEALEEKELQKLQERCLKRWKKLIVGLRIKQRLRDEYQRQTASAQKPTDGMSELRNVEPEPAEISIFPHSAVSLGDNRDGSNSHFELYTDHHINTLSMPTLPHYIDRKTHEDLSSEPQEFDAERKAQRNESATTNDKSLGFTKPSADAQDQRIEDRPQVLTESRRITRSQLRPALKVENLKLLSDSLKTSAKLLNEPEMQKDTEPASIEESVLSSPLTPQSESSESMYNRPKPKRAKILDKRLEIPHESTRDCTKQQTATRKATKGLGRASTNKAKENPNKNNTLNSRVLRSRK
ncbi:hypothetical protein O181_026643 [Austropuccinia psidii MF-1]|uniref:Uncharacterized protein n=1 Tax=Austropuccinia psidii MF-1 TaxID=1389203 RepID=A0A9Q3CQ70_9BASI|nr:hypothetical protein [Austropuccinia psidii MF-1]